MEKKKVLMTIFVVLLACSIFLQVGLAMFKTAEPKNVALTYGKKREDLPSSNEVNIVCHDCLQNVDHPAGQQAINPLPDSQIVSAYGLHALEKSSVVMSNQQFPAEPDCCLKVTIHNPDDEHNQRFFYESLGGEGHALINYLEVHFDSAYAYEEETCYITVGAHNYDAGVFGADLYVKYLFYSPSGYIDTYTGSKHYVSRGSDYIFPTLLVPIGSYWLPYTGPGAQDRVDIELWWDDSGNQRKQDDGWWCSFPVLDEDTTGPTYKNLDSMCTVYDDHSGSIRIQGDVMDPSGISSVYFGYGDHGVIDFWKSPSGSSGNTYWYDIPRSEWIQYVGDWYVWRIHAYDNDNDHPNDRADSYSDWGPNINIYDDDPNPPIFSNDHTSPSGTVYDSHTGDITCYIDIADDSGLCEVGFRYKFGGGPWSSWGVWTGHSAPGIMEFHAPVPRSTWIKHVGERLYHQWYAIDDDDDRPNDKESSTSGEYIGPKILDDDTSGPSITNVHADEYNGDGDWTIEDDEQVKISWSLSDPSGIYSTSCTVDGNSYPVQGSYYIICGPGLNPGSHSFVISATDNDNDRPNDRASSSHSSSFSVSDDDPNPPTFSNWYTSPSGTVYDSYTGYVRLGIDWEDPSSIYEVRFRYRYGSGSWSAWLPPTGSSGKSYWYDIPRSEWINNIDQTIYWESYATDNDNDRSGDRLTKYTSTFTGPTIRDDDTVGPSFSNPCPMDDIYDDYTGSYRVAIDVSDPSEIYAVEFSYRFDGGDWSCCHPYSGYSGNTYWYDIPRNVWIEHVGEKIYWKVDAEDNDNDRPGDRASSTSVEYPGGTIYDDDAIGPNIFDPWDSGGIYDDNLNDYRLQISATDPSGVSAVKFRYRFNSGPWSAWLPPTGSSGDTYWHDVSRIIWIEYVGKTIEWEAQAIDNDNDRANDQATSYSPTYFGGNIFDDDTTGPLISNPFSYENETTGLYRIQVNVSDPSGIYNVQFRYKFGTGSWHGWYDYSGSDGDIYWCDIPESEWTGHIGETIYWEAYAEDYDNDRGDDRATTTSPTYEAIIGQYQITFQQSGCPLPVNATIDDKNYTLPATFFWNKSSSHSISVPETINNTETGYVFIQWNDGNTSSSRTIVVTGAATYTAHYTPIGVHDVAVINVTLSKTIVGQGYCTNITVTVENQGDFEETFNVTVFYNETAVTLPDGKNCTTITLTSGNFTTITFLWNTTGVPYGNYTITAEAPPVPSEIDKTDNTLTDGWIIVTIPGDVDANKPPDDPYSSPGKVDFRDLFALAAAYGSKPRDPNWNPNCDIDGDNRVSFKDLFILAANYGKSAT